MIQSCDRARPLLYEETVPLLERASLKIVRYQTHSLLAFAHPSDVLFLNRLFRFVWSIRAITRESAPIDDLILALPGLQRAGLQVVGIAQKLAGR